MSDQREERLEQVVAEVLDPVRRYLVRRAESATADDVLGEVLLVCWRRIDEVPDPALPWAYGVARLCLANAERGERRQQRVAVRLAAEPGEESGAGSDLGSPDLELAGAVDRLAPDDAEVLRLWAWEGLAAREIAVALDVSPNAASVRLHRAKRRLRQAMAD